VGAARGHGTAGGMAAVADMVVQRYLTEEFRRAHPMPPRA
jgi:hypothetical protein